ncbi:MAG TPA: type II toxin-antitoxin system VapC family toxin [Candidatus Nanoarchaeia archaeon]|nr:type II toxin-antitoxin system VapC family toxin [Candidatus Nanoarchaeia archaeon]
MKWLNVKFLDTNVLAYAFYSNENMGKCQAAITEGGLTDTFNLTEAFHIIEKETGSREMAQRAIRGLLKSNVGIASIDVNAIFESVKKSGSLKLSIFDTIHYVCALANNCDSILSYDKDFDKLDIPREEP